jgi:hypothetical protein
MPPGDPVPAALKATFDVERDRVFGLLHPTPIRAANN